MVAARHYRMSESPCTPARNGLRGDFDAGGARPFVTFPRGDIWPATAESWFRVALSAGNFPKRDHGLRGGVCKDHWSGEGGSNYQASKGAGKLGS